MGDLSEKFMSRVIVDGECWIWGGVKNKAVYGFVKIKGRQLYAHRHVEEVVRVPILKGLVVRHWKCHNPSCVNPDHLARGTQKQDIEERDALGNGPRGSRCGMHKVTEVQVEEARSIYAKGGTTQKELAFKYGVTQACMSKALRGVTFSDLPNPVFSEREHGSNGKFVGFEGV
jgi:hypothetical protein